MPTTKPAESKFQGDILYPRRQFYFVVCSMTFYADFTLAKNEAFGDYHVDISQKSNRHIRATVKTYEKTGVYIFVKLFK